MVWTRVIGHDSRTSCKENKQPGFRIRESFGYPEQNPGETTKQGTGPREGTHCSPLNVLFSTPAWFSRTRTTALTRSSGVKNRAFVGESGNKNQKNIEVMRVRVPIMMKSHCQGSRPVVSIAEQPNVTVSTTATAVPLMRTGDGQKKYQELARITNVHQYPVLSICSVRV